MQSRLIALSGVVLVGCSIPIATQPQRLELVEDRTGEATRKQTECEKYDLKFERTQKTGNMTYDYYQFEGCGQKSLYFTAVAETNGWLIWKSGVIPAEDAFKRASQEQLEKTARFDLGCEELEYTVLSAVIAPEHTGFQATLGVSGCGKKSSYESMCQYVSYNKGNHEITCRATASAASGGAAAPAAPAEAPPPKKSADPGTKKL